MPAPPAPAVPFAAPDVAAPPAPPAPVKLPHALPPLPESDNVTARPCQRSRPGRSIHVGRLAAAGMTPHRFAAPPPADVLSPSWFELPAAE